MPQFLDKDGNVFTANKVNGEWVREDSKVKRKSSSRKVSRGSKAYDREKFEANELEREEQRRATLSEVQKAKEDQYSRRSLPQKMGIKYLREMDKIGAGLEDLGYFAQSLFSDKGYENKAKLVKEQNTKDELFSESDKDMGLSNIASLPLYVASGRYMSKPFDYLSNKVIDTLGAIPKKATSSLWNKITQPISKYADDTSVPMNQNILQSTGRDTAKKLAREVSEGAIKPINYKVAQFKSRPKIEDPFFDNMYRDIFSDTMQSAAESGIHYDETMGQGAISGMLGSASGKMFGAGLEKAPNLNTKAENELLDWAESPEVGFRTLPGMRTGQPKYQRFENDLRSDDKYSANMKAYDDANEKAVTKVAGRSMGMDSETMQDLTPAKLQNHLDDLSSQYQKLESDSVGKISKPEMIDLAKGIADLPKKEQNAVKEQMNKIIAMKQVGGKDEKGRFTAHTFDGKEYQKTRIALKDAVNTAFSKGNMASYNMLKDMVKKLDAGMELGVKKHGGKASSKQWRDLNEKWAITDLVMKNGMSPLGGIDTSKLSNYMMSPKEVNRTLLGRGNKNITDLQNIAKLDYIQKNQSGGGLSRLSSGGEDDRWDPDFKRQSFLNTPWSLKLPVVGRAKVGAYTSGYPSETGLLGLDRKGNYSAAKLGRALAQSTDAQRNLLEGTYDVGSSVYSELSSLLDGIDDKNEK